MPIAGVSVGLIGSAFPGSRVELEVATGSMVALVAGTELVAVDSAELETWTDASLDDEALMDSEGSGADVAEGREEVTAVLEGAAAWADGSSF